MTELTTPPTELTSPPTERKGGFSFEWRTFAVTLAAIVLALIAGAILMVVSDPDVISLYAYLFTAPSLPLGASWAKVASAYSALAIGAVGS
ncbi:MAG TPA: ABC transporter permease, partial [Propionibacterium sp.]|nr:ABC transporter permease [Propionibacterium sp.]